MDQEVTRNNLEKRLKKAALAWACTLTPPTAFVTLEGETEEILEEKLRRGRREGTFYKWSDDKETSDPSVVKNNMDQEVTRNNSEKRLKEAGLAWACTLSPPTACATPNLEVETEESLEEKLRRGRREGTFYKWSDDEETSEYNTSKED